MAVEYTVFCDDCGTIIAASRASVRDARARAQLDGGAVSSGGRDTCAACRKVKHALTGGPSPAIERAHSAGPR